MSDKAQHAQNVLANPGTLLPDLESVYKDIHSHPELSMEENRTAGTFAQWTPGLWFAGLPMVCSSATLKEMEKQFKLGQYGTHLWTREKARRIRARLAGV